MNLSAAGWKGTVHEAAPVRFKGVAAQAAIDAAKAGAATDKAPPAATTTAQTPPVPKTAEQLEDEELGDIPFIEPVFLPV